MSIQCTCTHPDQRQGYHYPNCALYNPVAGPSHTTPNSQEIYNQANREYLSASSDLSIALAKFNTAKTRLEFILSTWKFKAK